MSDRLRLREPVNVPDALARDALVGRIVALREKVVQDKAMYERWNKDHPNQTPLSTDFEDRMIAWLDGVGPKPPEVQFEVGFGPEDGDV